MNKLNCRGHNALNENSLLTSPAVTIETDSGITTLMHFKHFHYHYHYYYYYYYHFYCYYYYYIIISLLLLLLLLFSFIYCIHTCILYKGWLGKTFYHIWIKGTSSEKLVINNKRRSEYPLRVCIHPWKFNFPSVCPFKFTLFSLNILFTFCR